MNVSGIASYNELPEYLYDLKNLGYYLDGWADLIMDKGSQAPQVIDTFTRVMRERKLQGLLISRNFPQEAHRNRRYIVSAISPGATTITYIRNDGADLFVSWRSFIKPVFRKEVILLSFGVSALLAAYLGIDTGSTPLAVFSLIFTFILILGMIAFAGRAIKNDSLAYFFIEPTVFDADNIASMNLAVHKALLRALDKEGIDTSQLRLKQSFKGGRKNEDI